jgi:primosomal protein N' (replication factor Y)
VLVQSFQPEAVPFVHAVGHDVHGFLAGELERREALAYPPFGHLVAVDVAGPEPDAPLAALREVRARIARPGLTVLGPAPLLRLRGRHRARLILKTAQPRRVARELAALLEAATPALRRDGLTVVVDVDPS